MAFAQPEWLFALVALPIVALVEAWSVRRDRARTESLVSRSLWSRVLERPKERWRFVRLALLLVGVVGITLALARPQWGVVREKVEREGVDVVLVLDTSGSMATEDVSPNRFFLARAALSSLITQLDQDRFALVAFEGEAYPLVPLTLDADAVGLFLETLEPGFVPGPGSALGLGLAAGLELFVDPERRNKVMVLVSDGENLAGEVQAAIDQARRAGVVIHAVGVGTERGEPVPDFDENGERVGFKQDADGSVVVSRLDLRTLETISSGTGGRLFRVTPQDASLRPLAAAIAAMEDKALAREFAYRKKDRFQLPLGLGLVAIALGLLLPPPRLRRVTAPAPAARGESQTASRAGLFRQLGVAEPRNTPGIPAVRRLDLTKNPSPSLAEHFHHGLLGLALLGLAPAPTMAQEGSRLDELLLRPKRLTDTGIRHYREGRHPEALEAFEGALQARDDDAWARFNLADALYKNGKFDEAQVLYESLGDDAMLAAPARYNLGNTLFQKQDYPGAIKAYRDTLRVDPNDEETRRNLELALRKLQEQQQQQEQKQKDENDQQDEKDQDQQQDQKGDQDQDGQQDEKQQQDGQDQQKSPPSPNPKPKSKEQQEQERFKREAGMSKELAMQLLDALQRNEKEEQKKILAARQAKRKKTDKDW